MNSTPHNDRAPETHHTVLPGVLLRLVALPALALTWGMGTGVSHASGGAATPTNAQTSHLRATPNLTAAPHAASLSSTTTGTNTFVVTTATDSTACPDASGNISLRCAIQGANASPVTYAKVINFAIPAGDSHCGPQTINAATVSVCTISTTSDLPAINTSFVTVNGYTQSGAHVNTSASADNVILTIRVDGGLDGGSSSSSPAFDMAGNGDLVEGVSVTDFHSSSSYGDGIVMSGLGDKATGDFMGVAVNGFPAANDDGFSIYPNGVNTITRDVIGGTTPATRNVISGNMYEGVNLFSNGNTAEGNLIGTDLTGTKAIGSPQAADIFVSNASGNTIGGATAGARNVISANSPEGIYFWGGTGNSVEGNYIGTDVTGAKALGNGAGISFTQSSSHNTVGGSSTSDRNVISGNSTGVSDLSGGNVITNNYIGVSATKHSLPNSGDDIDLSGQGDAVTSNLIANNARAGVYVLTGSVGNVISRNSMYGNGNLGINLQGESQSTCPNGAVSGQANDYFDCPVITSATTTSISGTAPAANTVEVFLAQPDVYDGGYGEGLTDLGTTTATSSGTFTLAGSLTTGKLVTATVTGVGPSGSTETSEFSANATVN